MDLYRERLWPTPWLFITTLLILPGVILVFAPINMSAGIILAIALYAAVALFFIFATKSVRVVDGEFRAGRARIPLEFIGTPEAFTREQAALQRGQQLDARAWILLRGGIDAVVKVPILDSNDPTPYWLVSTRHPKRLVSVLTQTSDVH